MRADQDTGVGGIAQEQPVQPLDYRSSDPDEEASEECEYMEWLSKMYDVKEPTFEAPTTSNKRSREK